eukprot:CAMPEP_0197515808 /NCGR_PEP_ID=MMETSP1318-20131121/816_1 /TAXON_ID=552666 /ORGANISM="Partenskyella glossopodia, Strain RCC365" /LENGTH=396 /DNA_ID=CAMNT_0043064271 /DNA_START=336 /DNA_END=1526 /DNA_ORIENTATION=+
MHDFHLDNLWLDCVSPEYKAKIETQIQSGKKLKLGPLGHPGIELKLAHEGFSHRGIVIEGHKSCFPWEHAGHGSDMVQGHGCEIFAPGLVQEVAKMMESVKNALRLTDAEHAEALEEFDGEKDMDVKSGESRLTKVASWFMQFLSVSVVSSMMTGMPLKDLIPSSIFGASFHMRGYNREETAKDFIEKKINQKMGSMALMGMTYDKATGDVKAGAENVVAHIGEHGKKALQCMPAMYGAVGLNMGGLLFNDRSSLLRPGSVTTKQANVDPACARLATLQFVKNWHRVDQMKPYALSLKDSAAFDFHDNLVKNHDAKTEALPDKTVKVSSDCFLHKQGKGGVAKAINCFAFAECAYQLTQAMCSHTESETTEQSESVEGESVPVGKAESVETVSGGN